jgi:hypothetical protein
MTKAPQRIHNTDTLNKKKPTILHVHVQYSAYTHRHLHIESQMHMAWTSDISMLWPSIFSHLDNIWTASCYITMQYRSGRLIVRRTTTKAWNVICETRKKYDEQKILVLVLINQS